MNKLQRLTATLAAVCALATTAHAQTSHSAYFLDGVATRNQLNAALMPKSGYFTLPALGNLNITAGTNFGVGSLLYESSTNSNTLNTFLHPDVSTSTFLENVNNYNDYTLALNTPVISFGFFKWGGFNTFDLSVQAEVDTSISGDIFRFLKVGQGSNTTTYDFSNTGAYGAAYGQLALGHTRVFLDGALTAGARLKYLYGVMSVKGSASVLGMTLSNDEWVVSSQAEGVMGRAGNGFAVDLGATFEIVKGLTVSASVNDLGSIRWGGKNTAYQSEGGEICFTGLEGISTTIDTSALLEDLSAEFKKMTNFEEVADAEAFTYRLSTDMNVGVEYSFLDNKLSAGVLYTTHFLNSHTTHQGLLALNMKALSWLNVAGTYTLSNYGSNFGGVLCFCPKGFNFYIGADYGVPTTTTSFIPVASRFGLNLNLGINFTFGQNPFKGLSYVS